MKNSSQEYPGHQLLSNWIFYILISLNTVLVAATPATAQTSDDFSASQLDTTLWQTINPRQDGAVSLHRGTLALHLPSGLAHSATARGNMTLRLMQDLPDTNLSLSARFTSVPRQIGQQQGLIVAENDGTYLRFYAHHTGQQLELRWARVTNHITLSAGQTPIAAADTMQLRLTRQGGQWICEHASGLNSWSTTFTVADHLQLTRGGVYAANIRPDDSDSPYDLDNPPTDKVASGGPAPAFTVLVDYVFDTQHPIVPEDGAVSTAARTFTGLKAFYLFRAGSPTIAFDYANTGAPYHLTQLDTTTTSRLEGHGLRFDAPSIVTAPRPATTLNADISATGEITLESWLRPASTNQSGPARILTISADPSHRNATLSQGQWGSLPSDVFDVRLRTSGNSLNGQPDLVSPAGSLTGGLQHVVYTRDTAGNARVYVDGSEVANGTAPGDFSTWDPTYPLALGGEIDGSRNWLGTLFLAAIYSRALTPLEISANYSAGPDGGVLPPLPPAVILQGISPGAMFTFVDTIPLSAVANDADGTIAAVEFRIGATVLHRDETPPYAFSWVAPATGGHQITAVAIDSDGLETASDVVPIYVGTPTSFTHALSLSDAFADSALGAPWRITDGTSGTAINQAAGSVYLHLPAASQGLWDATTAVCHADQNETDTNLALELMVDTSPWTGTAFTGLEVADSLGATVRYVLIRHDGVWTLNWGQADLGAPHLTGARSIGAHSGPIWLQLRREGNTCVLFHSFNGQIWLADATVQQPLTMNRAGWLAGAISGPATVVLDHAFNLVAPISPEDGAPGDSTGPVISQLTVSPDFTQATLDWSTNELAYSRLNYGLTNAYELGTIEGGFFTTTHHAVLTGLAPGQTYHYQLVCLDISGNITDTGDKTAYTDLHATTVLGPTQGDVYRESELGFGVGNDNWRVTDPNAQNTGAAVFLPNATLTINVPDLTGAVRAELVIDRWGGHAGTTGKRIRLNGGSWLHLPDPETIPGGQPECYVYADNPLIALPLDQLSSGAVTLEGSTSGQTCFNFNWGQWGWYGVVLRIYYDNTVVGPTGAFLTPARGDTITDTAAISLTASSPGTVNLIHVLARYEGFDEDGDGHRNGWHRTYRRARYNQSLTLTGIVGTITTAPWDVIWDATWVPDQVAGTVGLQARIQDNTGLWAVTELDSLSLNHTGGVVKAYPLLNVPRSFWVRAGQTKSANFNIPSADSLGNATAALLTTATWNSADQGKVAINGTNVASGFGDNHYFSLDSFNLPTANLNSGTNTLTISSNTIHHGMEMCWPGPLVRVLYATPAAAAVGFARRQPGDVDGNGRFDAQDARLILGHIVGKAHLKGAQLAAADRNQNGRVELTDAGNTPPTPLRPTQFSARADLRDPHQISLGAPGFAGQHAVQLQLVAPGLATALNKMTLAFLSDEPTAWHAHGDTLRLAGVGIIPGEDLCRLTLANGLGTITVRGTVDGKPLQEFEITAPNIPAHFELVGNYPNPFNPATTIAFNLPRSAKVRLRVHDLRGHLVATIVDGTLPAGRYQQLWNGRDRQGRPAASGTFFYRLEADGQVWTRKMLLLK